MVEGSPHTYQLVFLFFPERIWVSVWAFHELMAKPQSHLSLATTPPFYPLLLLCKGGSGCDCWRQCTNHSSGSADAGEQLVVVRSPGRYWGHGCQNGCAALDGSGEQRRLSSLRLRCYVCPLSSPPSLVPVCTSPSAG